MPMTAPLRTFGGALVLVLFSWGAEGATLTVDAPEGCVEISTLEQEVAALVGHSLAEVADADFRLAIRQLSWGKPHWHLRLEAEERGAHPPATHVRELDAPTCDQLAEAAAVAIAVSVRALAKDEAPPPSRPSAAVAVKSAPPLPSRVAPGTAAEAPWRALLTFAVTGDAGDLPGVGLGLRVGATLTHAALRAALALGWIPPRDSLMPTGSGGRFQLGFAAADGCWAPQRNAWTFLVCAGGELGAYGAEGVGVTSSFSRTTLWRAARAAVGATLALGGPVALVLEAGAALPLSRPSFVLDGVSPVYRPASVAVRGGLGLEYWF
jgi:hypothetical protein